MNRLQACVFKLLIIIARLIFVDVNIDNLVEVQKEILCVNYKYYVPKISYLHYLPSILRVKDFEKAEETNGDK
jgi:hypothetical protein